MKLFIVFNLMAFSFCSLSDVGFKELAERKDQEIKYQKTLSSLNLKKTEQLHQDALSGNPIAQSLLGILYNLDPEIGKKINFPLDRKKSKMWYKKAAKQGDIIAAYELGFLLYAENDFTEAEKLFKRIVKKGFGSDVFLALAQIHHKKGNKKEEEQWLKRAFKEKNILALPFLVQIHVDRGEIIEANDLLVQAEEMNLGSEIIMDLANIYRIAGNETVEKKWLKMALKQNNSLALVSLVNLYLDKGRLLRAKKMINQFENSKVLESLQSQDRVFYDLAKEIVKKAFEKKQKKSCEKTLH